MALEIRTICKKCETGFALDGEAHVWSHERTFRGPRAEAIDPQTVETR